MQISATLHQPGLGGFGDSVAIDDPSSSAYDESDMKFYSGIKNVPELQGLSRAERRKVLRDCFFKHGFRLWQFWVGQLAIVVLAIMGDVVGVVLQYGYGFSDLVCFACGLVGVVMGCLIYSWIYYTVVIERLRPHFRDYLVAHGRPV